MTTYNGAEESMIDLWVQNRLTSHSAFNSLYTGLTGKVFNRLAYGNPTYPYIVFQAQSPPEVIRGVGLAEVMVSTIYVVKAIAQCNTYEPLAGVAAEIRSAMVTPASSTVPGGIGEVFMCRYERQFTMVETEQGTQFRHMGGEFLIQAQAA